MASKNVPKGKGIALPKADQSPDGFFTLREAAQAVGLQEQWSTAQIDSLTALLLKAVQRRKLILIDPHSQMPNPDLTARDFYGWITRTAFNNWAQGEGALYWWHDPQKPTVVLNAGTAYVPFSNIAHELAYAIHGPGHGNMAYGVDRINFGDEANKAALHNTLPLKIPSSHVPQAIVVGRARDDSEVAVQDLADFAARFSIDVVVLGQGRVNVGTVIDKRARQQATASTLAPVDPERLKSAQIGAGIDAAIKPTNDAATNEPTARRFGYQRDGGITALIVQAQQAAGSKESRTLVFAKLCEWAERPESNPAPKVLLRTCKVNGKRVLTYMNGDKEDQMTIDKLRWRLKRLNQKNNM